MQHRTLWAHITGDIYDLLYDPMLAVGFIFFLASVLTVLFINNPNYYPHSWPEQHSSVLNGNENEWQKGKINQGKNEE